ncbi:MAG: hypothetical protein IJ658_07060 [Kiritimatiellae bacterium]|nr:hypothetical protein [Kiritimatiellia bacterium]
MKKLMLAAAAAALTGGAFAAPLVYDYKASVTHMYVKLVKVTNKVTNQRVDVYQKFKKNASLKGYLVWDTDGATSPFLTQAQANFSTAQVYDQGRNRAFLVVLNSSAESEVRRPKILPAVLDAKWFDTKFTHSNLGVTSYAAGIAEGTLFVGGQLINSAYAASARAQTAYAAVAPVRPKLELNPFGLFGVATPFVTPEMYSDYLWSSCYLFGQYNGPQWSGGYQFSETAINGVQPVFFRLPATHTFAAASPVYHDSWMNHAGIGTSELVAPGAGQICCGLSVAGAQGAVILNSLSGQMKGGIYICSDNGLEQASGVYSPFLFTLWEDQFFAPADQTQGRFWADTVGYNHDVWVDGDIEQNTTDVAFGSWSIKRTTSVTPVALTSAERNNLLHATYAAGASAVASWTVNGVAGTTAAPAICSNADLNDLNETIKGAAVKLFSGVNFCDGREIYDMTVATRFNIPFLTPLFARAYGLAGYGL